MDMGMSIDMNQTKESNMTNERKMVKREVASLNFDYYTLSEAISSLRELLETHGQYATLELVQKPYDDGYYLSVMKKEPETDKEYNDRLLRIQRQEDYDRQKYLELKKKFEGK